ncbi:DUF6287 domain-containing protein [Lactococcus lactis]|uniref:DUF6287 domain-containing protein n=1 Tax=Lactococcus lactis TaxID=1358 RepID=A0A3S3PAT9_9LACT|nr:DUF6287 domain-containing protein [Lactococcus lactis]KRO22867.1 hypothetical protein IV65_GL002101 [Lactococcus lactis subsp. lactis]MDA2898512.1 DUF6287 domain-containing protein [Lactococcus lactis]NYZ59063.1 hypothetical protein [Lactococcus lactis]RWR46867.1 hypothetical protein EO246_07635 [Lactococcus lactis]UTG79474.1 DUF6287 domain-containing protein [Lactococcus lactis]
MEKTSANIKKFVGISLITLGTLTVLTACGSKESKKSEQSSFSSSINNKSSQSSSSSNSSSTNSSSSSSTQEGFGDVPQILSGNYSSLNGTWQTADGSTKIILNNGNIIFSPEYERIISNPMAKDGIIIADALNDKRHMGFMFAAAHNSPIFPNSSNVDKTDSGKDRFIITTDEEGIEIFDTMPTAFFYKVSNDTTL